MHSPYVKGLLWLIGFFLWKRIRSSYGNHAQVLPIKKTSLKMSLRNWKKKEKKISFGGFWERKKVSFGGFWERKRNQLWRILREENKVFSPARAASWSLSTRRRRCWNSVQLSHILESAVVRLRDSCCLPPRRLSFVSETAVDCLRVSCRLSLRQLFNCHLSADRCLKSAEIQSLWWYRPSISIFWNHRLCSAAQLSRVSRQTVSRQPTNCLASADKLSRIGRMFANQVCPSDPPLLYNTDC